MKYNRLILLDDGAVDGGTASAGTIDTTKTTDTPTVDTTAAVTNEIPDASKSGLPKQPITGKRKETAAVDTTGDIESFDDMDDHGITKVDLIAKSKEDSKKNKDAEDKSAKDKLTATGLDKDGKPIIKNDDGGRNYSFAPDDLKPIFKKSTNEIFNWLKENFPKLKSQETELTNLRKGTPASYHEHPAAFQLSSTYIDATSNYRKVALEERHWLEQAKNIHENKPWKDIKGFDKNGNLVVSDESFKPDSFDAKDTVTSSLAKARQYKEKFAADANAIRTNHVAEHTKIVAGMRGEMIKYFPWMKDDKALTEPMDLVDPSTSKEIKAPIADVIKYGVNLIPAQLRGSPLTELVGNLYALLAIQGTKLIKYEQQLKVKKVNTEHQEVAEPVGAGKSGARKGAAEVSKSIDSVSDMDE